MALTSSTRTDAPRYVHPRDDESSGSLSVPMAISRSALESRKEDYYGKWKEHIHLGWIQDSSRGSFAPASLTLKKSTVLGSIDVHTIKLAENSIFYGPVRVARIQMGCMRFCYVPGRSSRTPRRYNCRPDMAFQGALSEETHQEALRVRPQFKSTHYGEPNY
jgi:hypothetical protein